MRKRIGAVIGAGAMALILLTGGAAGALSDPGGVTETTVPLPVVDGAFEILEEWTPTADELAEINAQTAKEIEALKAAGVKVTVETDELGFEYPIWDADQDEAAIKVLDELYGDQFGFEEWTPTAEELAEINAQTDEEAKALTDVGVKFTVETDGFGIRYIVWDAGQDEAAMKVYQELYGDEPGLEEWTPTAEELAEINAQTAKEIAALKAAGVKVTVETDDLGFEYPIWDADQDEAAMKVLDELYGIELGDVEDFPGFGEYKPTAEEVAAANADMAEEMAALKAAGVKFTVETDEFGFEYPVWEDDQAEAAMKVYEELYGLGDVGDYDDIDELPVPDEPPLPDELKTVGSMVPPEAP